MLGDSGKFSLRVAVLVSLVAALVLTALVAIPQVLSRQARLEVLRSHVAQVAQLAASVVDGDLHRQLLEPQRYTPELYQRALAPLVRFHSAAPEIFYVYTMVERAGTTHFVLDTAASSDLQTPHQLRPSAYMQAFRNIDADPDPDWLERIARGQTYVYPSFQRDVYGTFLSGHAPIHDSQGQYSGFVGVDFDLHYYLHQEASFRRILHGSVGGSILVALLIGCLAARYHHRVHDRINEQYRISMQDELTQLLNRRGALRFAQEAMAQHADSYAMILVDIDDLKGINDRHGHAAGDEYIVKVARALDSSVRRGDVCARMGGDEFMIFAANCTHEQARRIAQQILGLVYADDSESPRSHYGVSIGICVTCGPVSFKAMYRHADTALYEAKNAGRNRYVIFDSSTLTLTTPASA